MIAVGVGLVACLVVKLQNSGQGTRPRGDVLSWFVHTRVGLGRKSFLAKQLELTALLRATVGELLIVSLYVGWLAVRFAYFLERFATQPTVAVRVGKAFGELGPPMILMTYLLSQRYTIWGWVSGIPHERLIAYHRLHGWTFFAVITAHMICMATAMRQRVGGFPIVRQIDSKMDIMRVNPQLGVAAYIMWTFTVLSALDIMRRKNWGYFYAAHFAFFPVRHPLLPSA